MKRAIREYGDPVLREVSVPVAEVDAELRALAEEMVEAMRANTGVGLAAQQIGETRSICVVEVPEEYDLDDEGNRLNPDLPGMPWVLLNPRILSSSAKTDSHEEGCLSFPGIRGSIVRPVDIRLAYMDLEGRSHELDLRGFVARVVQHEVDHLNGVLFIDRMSAAKKFTLRNRLRKMKEETEAMR
ncbi:MAG TPA: peptide deformylase [Kiritimatiellia bacterium]|nr:peptide deformylase [Kiritimatiellia bacterium]